MKGNYAVVLEDFPSSSLEEKIANLEINCQIENLEFDDFLSELEKINDPISLVLGNMADVFRYFMREAAEKQGEVLLKNWPEKCIKAFREKRKLPLPYKVIITENQPNNKGMIEIKSNHSSLGFIPQIILL